MSKVSIITPSYNSSQYISTCIESVLNQTYEDWELIITDDCSTDNSVQIINEYIAKDSRVKLFILDKNSGAATARNNSLQNAVGDFIAFLDSDDLWLSNKLEEQIRFMKKNEYPITFTEYNLQGKIEVVKEINYKGYLKNTIIGMSTSVINRKLVGDFNFANLRTRQDTYLWISLLKKGFKAYGLPITLASYRVRKDSISANKFKAAKQVWFLYYNMEKLGFLKASYYFFNYIFNALKKRYI